MSLGAEGSCQIGGNLSTNAGGIAVLRYGNTRELTLGVEVVLPDGRVWDGLRGLRKDNTGYDLKQLFIGGEGTLGIITAATIKLFPKPREVETAFLGLPRVEDAMSLFAHARAASADQLTAFELIPRAGLDLALVHIPGTIDPLEARQPWYVLLEMSSSQTESGIRTLLERLLETALDESLIADGVIAESGAQAKELWRIREAIVEAQLYSGSIKHDVAVPVSRVAEFINRASAGVGDRLPGIRPIAFGHVGDGNIHFNLTQPEGMDKAAYLARWQEFNDIVHAVVRDLSGLDQRRARRRHHEARRDHPLQAGGRDRADAPGQARLRPRQHHEPRQARQLLGSPPPPTLRRNNRFIRVSSRFRCIMLSVRPMPSGADRLE